MADWEGAAPEMVGFSSFAQAQAERDEYKLAAAAEAELANQAQTQASVLREGLEAEVERLRAVVEEWDRKRHEPEVSQVARFFLADLAFNGEMTANVLQALLNRSGGEDKDGGSAGAMLKPYPGGWEALDRDTGCSFLGSEIDGLRNIVIEWISEGFTTPPYTDEQYSIFEKLGLSNADQPRLGYDIDRPQSGEER